MQARLGDHIVVKNHRIGVPDQECEVLEVRGPDGGPPYLVRWQESGQQALFFPGPDVVVQRCPEAPGPGRAGRPAQVE